MLSGIKLSQEPDTTQPFIESYCCVFKPSELKGKGKILKYFMTVCFYWSNTTGSEHII